MDPTTPDHSDHLTRRSALALGGVTIGGLVAATSPTPSLARGRRIRSRRGRLPAGEIQSIVGAEGSFSGGVLGIEVERKDIGSVKGPGGVELTPSFEIHGSLFFQPLSNTRAFFNGDLALKASELNPVIDAILANDLVFQAMHQHFFDLDPMVWFIHFRGVGEPKALARAVRKVIDVTSTPLPQKTPSDPETPLDHARLAKILHGSSEIGGDGVVTVTVNRKDRILIGDVHVSPEAGISTNVEFRPLDRSGHQVAVVPDFAMTVGEIGPVCRTMRAAGFEIGCLYNQETGEHPQLYFAHMLATGSPDALARTIRQALDHTRAA